MLSKLPSAILLTLATCLAIPGPLVAKSPMPLANDSGNFAEAIRKTISDFELPDTYGKKHRLSDYDAPVLVVTFLGTECPLAKLYVKRLADLASEYPASRVAFVGIDSNQQDSLTELAAFKHRFEAPFPLLKDDRAQTADQFGATRTPEVFVLDRNRAVRYQGRIDDQYSVGIVRDAPSQSFLKEAIDALLAGKEVLEPQVAAVGCLIGRPREVDPNSQVTYSNQISRLFQKHCVECHREGEIAPFALTDYEEAVGWAETVAEVVKDQRMPPWHANPEFGHFADERLLTDEEKQLIYDWVEAGAPEGDPSQVPEPRQFVEGWRLPKEPDVVLPMRKSGPFKVPAEGVIEYQYFAVDPGFTEDTWIQAADIVPGCRSVVHHVILFVSPPQEDSKRGLGWLSAYVPGQGSMQLPEGQARLIPAGSKLIFQMHYTPTGVVEEDLTKVGLVFADPETVKEEVVTLYSINSKFEIPPHAADYQVNSSLNWFPEKARLLGVGPHMHTRGTSFRITGIEPTGEEKVLLDVPNYDFNWQNNFRFVEPITIPPGYRVECEARYDNSKNNLTNPDPTVAVRWGDQTFQEMMIAFFEVAVPRDYPWRSAREANTLTDDQRKTARQVADQLFARFDRNSDDELSRKELPDAFAIFAFRRYDRNGDRVIRPEEAYQAALDRIGS